MDETTMKLKNIIVVGGGYAGLHAMRAEQAIHLEEKERLLHAVVVGGGITGIEIAAELAACLRAKGLSLGLGKARNVVSLIHTGDRLLSLAPRKIGEQLERRLRKSGVSLIKNTRALHYKEGAVKPHHGRIAASLCVWALGTSPNPLVQRIGLPVQEEGRLLVDASYRVQGHKNIYAIGDCAYVTDRSGRRLRTDPSRFGNAFLLYCLRSS